jgi:type II secretion system protein D
MRVFRLRHVSATLAQQSVQNFFSGRTGLGPQVNAIADTRSNSLIVHAAPRDMEAVAKLIADIDVADTASRERLRIFELQHSLAADLAQTLNTAIATVRGSGTTKSSTLELLAIDAGAERIIKSGILDGVQITPNTQTNSLLVTAPVDNMELIAALIEQLDKPTSTAQIKVFRIINGDANSLVLMLRSLLPSRTGTSTGPQLAGAEGESSLAPLRFSVERRTNSIIATGSAGDLRIVEALLMRLDQNDMQRRKNTVYRLRNAPAIDVARAINDFLTSQQRIQRLAPGEISPFEVLESEVIVVPEQVSNTLIVSATPRFYEEIMDLIERLDDQPPQVMIQVVIAEVALGDFDEFGVEVGLQDSVLFDRSLLGDLATTVNSTSASTPSGIITDTNEIVQAASNIPGFLFNDTGPLGNSGSDQSLASRGRVGSQGISNFAVGRINNELGFGGLVLSASSESVSILVRALQESRRLQVLSRPQIMTLDNQGAFVQVGQQVPYVTQSQLTTFGQINTVELIDTGLILGVTPRISPEGVVFMEIDAEQSKVGPELEGVAIAITAEGDVVRSPRIDIARAQTTVSAASGETIVLGGLITTRDRDIHRRVPLLAEIPLLGDLFRFDSVESARAELLIILTPHVVLGPADTERIKQTEMARMSWCAADIHAMLDELGRCQDPNCPVCRSKVPVIYPDENPRGVIEPGSPGISPSE